ncbi:MAG: cell wall-binding repeat-containing protein [Actinobacteria bacterium]|nr:cell wall-binding repeat-containing protein [Actinomycetota bacterium]
MKTVTNTSMATRALLALALMLSVLMPTQARAYEREPNDTMATASPAPVGPVADDAPAQIAPAGDVDWYSFVAEGKWLGVYTAQILDVEKSLSAGFRVTAYDASGRLLATSFPGSSTVVDTVEVPAFTAGRYYLKVESADRTQTGGYYLRIWSQFQDPAWNLSGDVEQNGTRFIAKQVPIGTAIRGRLDEPAPNYLSRADADVFWINPAKTSTYAATITSTTTSLRIRTLDTDGFQTDENTCAASVPCRFDVTAPAGKRSYIEVTPGSPSGFGYYAVCLRAPGQWCDDSPVDRLWGADRYATSVAIAQQMLGEDVGGDTIVVASGEVVTDALSVGSPASGLGPLLLVTRDRIPAVVAKELRRIGPARIVLVGGPNTISADVENQLRGYLDPRFPNASLERWWGADRYATSATISTQSFKPGVEMAFIASGQVYADALAGAAAAGRNVNGQRRDPVLLVDDDRIPSSIAAELRRLKPGRIVVLGGPNTIRDNVLADLAAYTSGSVERWAGSDRYSTAATISRNAYAVGEAGEVFIASGEVFSDALALGPMAGHSPYPILLVRSDSIPSSTLAELRRLHPRRIHLIGGPATISDDVRLQLEAFAGYS